MNLADRLWVVSAGFGKERFVKKAARLRDELGAVSDDLHITVYVGALPPGCPPHKLAPMACKLFAVQDAVASGARYVLWLDAGFRVHKPLTPILDEIRTRGYWFRRKPRGGGETIAKRGHPSLWLPLGISPEQAGEIRTCLPGAHGLDVRHSKGALLFQRMTQAYLQGAYHTLNPNWPPSMELLTFSALTHELGLKSMKYPEWVHWRKGPAPEAAILQLPTLRPRV